MSNAEKEEIKNIVLVGRTGNGKSATANSIAMQNVFRSVPQAAGVTQKCQTLRVATHDGPILNLIDTPGLFDLSLSADFISKEIVSCLTLAEGGLHAVLLVLSVRNRISQEEELVLSTLQRLFGAKIASYLIVVFTAGDVLEESNITLEEYLGDNIPDFLKKVLRLCGNRMIAFDNKTTDTTKKIKQVHDLVTLIDLVRKQTNNTPYTNETYYQIKEETDRHNKELEKLDKEGLSTGLMREMMKELRLMYEQNLKALSDSMAETVRQITEEQKKNYEKSLDQYKKIAAEEREILRQRENDSESSCHIL